MYSIQCHTERHIREIRQKIIQYQMESSQIVKEREKLRNVFFSKMILKDGKLEKIYPEKFYELDREYKKLQKMIWDSIFKESETLKQGITGSWGALGSVPPESW